MQFSHVKTISEYNTLLNNLNTLGKYQIRIFAICAAYWMLAGIFKTIFELGFSSVQCPYALGIFEGIGLLFFCSLANLKGRKVGTIIGGIVSLIGFVLSLFAIMGNVPKAFATIGFAILSLSIYSQPCLILCIVCELTTLRAIQVVFSISLAMFSTGKIIGTYFYNLIDEKNYQNPDLYISAFILAPACFLSITLGIFINDSPRYFIENNIHKAEKLIRSIVRINGGKQNEVISHIDQNFIVKRIHLRRYNYLTLTKFNSFGFSQYCTIIVLLLLGIISRESSFIFQQKTTMVPEQIQIVWISSFQIFGVITSIFFLSFCKRRQICCFTSLLIAIVSTILYFIYDQKTQHDLVLLGLNAVFSIILYAFLVINVIQFYPHSVRTLGMGVMLSCYYFGQLLFYIYLLVDPEPKMVLELFLMGSWIMLAHCFGQRETLNIGLTYEIKEIEEEENQEI